MPPTSPSLTPSTQVGTPAGAQAATTGIASTDSLAAAASESDDSFDSTAVIIGGISAVVIIAVVSAIVVINRRRAPAPSAYSLASHKSIASVGSVVSVYPHTVADVSVRVSCIILTLRKPAVAHAKAQEAEPRQLASYPCSQRNSAVSKASATFI